MNIKPEEYINFHGPEWAVLKQWLLAKQETQMGILISDITHDKANQIRGSLSLIRELLALEKAAQQSR